MKSKKAICPPNKFGFGNKCVTWLYILSIFALFAAIIICVCLYFDKVSIHQFSKYDDLINTSSTEININNDVNLKNKNSDYKIKNFNDSNFRNLLNSNFDDKSVNKSMRFRYVVRANMYDETQNFVTKLTDKFDEIYELLNTYVDLDL